MDNMPKRLHASKYAKKPEPIDYSSYEAAEQAHWTAQDEEIKRLTAELKAKDERIKELQEYIRIHSGHHYACGRLNGLNFACVCGYEQALKGGEPAKEQQ